MTYPKEVEETLRTPMEVEPLDQTKLEDVSLNNHSIPTSYMEVPIFEEPEPQPQPLDDPKKHYGFKPGLLGQSGSLGVDFSDLEVIENDFLEGLNLPMEPKELENVRLNLNQRLYLMRRSLEVLRKFHQTILEGRFNQLSHVSSTLLSKPGSN
ncbi:hypothetical protein Tco_0647961 [Tanacetum coccineum]